MVCLLVQIAYLLINVLAGHLVPLRCCDVQRSVVAVALQDLAQNSPACGRGHLGMHLRAEAATAPGRTPVPTAAVSPALRVCRQLNYCVPVVAEQLQVSGCVHAQRLQSGVGWLESLQASPRATRTHHDAAA